MNLIYFIGFCFMIINSSSALPWCTQECNCSIITGMRTFNHAQCTEVTTLLEGKNIPIHSLDISNTNLTKLPHLEKLRNLFILNASNNLLSDIDHLGKRIKTLDLSHNKITSAKLGNIPSHIENLDLSYNEITYLPLELTKLNKLKSIQVIGNAINCTCETIQVRNWMQTQVVWTDNLIKCSYPTTVKGMPWLQVKESVICGRKMGSEQEDEINNDENELMLGDQPMNDEGSAEKENNEELGKDYLLVDKKGLDNDEFTEGSGDLGIKMERLQSDKSNNSTLEASKEDEEEEGSGSGFGPIAISLIQHEQTSEKYMEETSSSTGNDTFDEPLGIFEPKSTTEESTTEISTTGSSTAESSLIENSPIENSPIESSSIESSPTESSSTEELTTEEQQEVTEELIMPIRIIDANQIPNKESEAEKFVTEPVDVEVPNTERITKSNTANTGTHILLGVIGILIICLVLFIVFKRMSKRKQRHDPENPRLTEMKDMDKKNLGKPVQKNGNGVHEHKPLIPENNDKPLNGKIIPYNELDKNIQEPLLNNKSNNADKPESNNNIETPIPTVRQSLLNAQPPVSPRTPSRYGPYPPPKSPQRPSSPSSDDEAFQPSSPSQRRYSPVYSPETGKVKIKLSETPKPKTPMLVTRSRSNAGEIITIPAEQQEQN